MSNSLFQTIQFDSGYISPKFTTHVEKVEHLKPYVLIQPFKKED